MLCENPLRKTGLTTLFHEFVSRGLKLFPEVRWLIFAGPNQEWTVNDPRVEMVRDFPANDQLNRRPFADHFQVPAVARARGADVLVTVGARPEMPADAVPGSSVMLEEHHNVLNHDSALEESSFDIFGKPLPGELGEKMFPQRSIGILRQTRDQGIGDLRRRARLDQTGKAFRKQLGDGAPAGRHDLHVMRHRLDQHDAEALRGVVGREAETITLIK